MSTKKSAVEKSAVLSEPTVTPVKPGFLSSELWATLAAVATNVIAVLVVLGRVSAESAGEVTQAVTELIGSLGMVAANAALIWRYIKSRQALKSLHAVQVHRLQLFDRDPQVLLALSEKAPTVQPLRAKK